jgi:hypothetical protein
MTQAYPLKWPDGWPRMSRSGRKRAKFSRSEQRYQAQTEFQGARGWKEKKELSISDGTKRIIAELKTLKVGEGQWVISTDLELRNDGLPRSGQRQPEDPGVAVYWTRRGKQQVMAIDIYDRVADNLAAVAASLNALRAIERHGGAQILERAFEGFAMLVAPDAFDCWAVLGLRRGDGPFTKEAIDARYRELAKSRHPDATGGSTEEFQKLQRARDEAMKPRDF